MSMSELKLSDAVSITPISVQAWSNEQREANVRAIQAAANAWRFPGSGEYLEQVGRRLQYLGGDVITDLKEQLKILFPESWVDVSQQLIALSLVEHIVDKRAQVFRGKGAEFGLRAKGDKKELEPEHPAAKAFAEMIRQAKLSTSLLNADKMLELCHDAAVKVWWDDQRKHVRLSLFGPNKAHVMINPDAPWSMDAAQAVALERTGVKGIGSIRHEIWGARDEEQGEEGEPRVFSPTLHYVDDGANGATSMNADDANPFVRRETGEPMYPISWWQDYEGDLYSGLGGDSLVMMCRAVNIGLTWLNFSAGWEMAPVAVLEVMSGQGPVVDKSLSTIKWSPGKATRLPAGVSLSFVKPGFEPRPFTDLFEMLLQYQALTQQLSPKQLDIRGGMPQSGIALQIELSGLLRYRDERVDILEPHVLDLLERMIVVHNYYAEEKIPDEFEPYWCAGQLDAAPEDAIAIADQYEREIEAGVSSPVDWIMHRHGVDREQAEVILEENLARKKESQASTTRYPGFGSEEEGSPFLAKKGFQPKKDDEEDEEEEEEGA